MNEVTLDIKEYNNLKITEAKYWQLQAAGVDNWTFYGCNCHDLGEDECIFCTEDEEEFLGLESPKNKNLEDILVVEEGDW